MGLSNITLSGMFFFTKTSQSFSKRNFFKLLNSLKFRLLRRILNLFFFVALLYQTFLLNPLAFLALKVCGFIEHFPSNFFLELSFFG
jgi:hypothetical protein